MDTLSAMDWVWFLKMSLPWLLPLLGGFLVLGVGAFRVQNHFLSFGIALASLLVSFVMAWKGYFDSDGDMANMFLFDSLSYFFLLLFLLSGLLTLILSYPYWNRIHIERPEYYALLLFSIFGMGCMVGGVDLILVFIGLEIMSIAIYILVGFHRSRRTSVEAALKYFLTGAFASGFLILGIAFIYGATGTTDLSVLYQKGMDLFAPKIRWYSLLGYGLLSVGIGFKIALVPFHFWAADVYEGAPIPVTSFMATAVKAAGFAVLLRIAWAIFQWEPEFLRNLAWIGAALTMTVGNVAALSQKNLKRMLAFSSVAHAGYLMVPLTFYSTNNLAAMQGIGFYLVAYIVMTTGAFGLLMSLSKNGQEPGDIQELNGIGLKKPFLGFAFTLFMLSLAGFPPTIGFFGKYYIFAPAIRAGEIAIVVIALLNSVISVYYYLRPVVVMYFGADQGKILSYPPLPMLTLVAVLFCLLTVGYFGIFPSQLLNLVQSIR